MKLLKTCISASLILTITACGSTDIKETLGLRKKAPDEFMVLSRPPLSLPPNFYLKKPGSVKPEVKPNFSLSILSSGETNLLKQAGSNEISSNIRELLKKDIEIKKAINSEEKESFFSKVTTPIKSGFKSIGETLHITKADDEDKILNPDAEKKRLIKQKDKKDSEISE